MINLSTATNIQAELWAIYTGLSIAWKKGIQRLTLETDSSVSLHIIDKCNIGDDSYNIVAAIRDLKTRDWHCDFHFSWREGNACADFLAKGSIDTRPGLIVLDRPPPGLHHLLQADIAGIGCDRRILVSC